MAQVGITANPRARRLRAAAAMHGGASGLLRLSQPSQFGSLPLRGAVNAWAQRAGSAFDSVPAVLDGTPSEAFITRLLPSTAALRR